ncbi:MAG TPA: protein kinase, partial [Myxococcota bacterium]|nr:protein kinase [Myxococcota bacterium]
MHGEQKIIPSSPVGKLGLDGRITLDLTVPFSELNLVQMLGEGAYGTVYQGEWKSSKVAVKKLKVQNFSPEALEEFRQEAQIMFQLGNESDHIVRLKKICLESPNYSLVMELMPKGSLYDLLQNRQELPWPIRYRIALDIAHGLETLHGYNILHRDLKSLNVLLDDRLRAKLSDFGLSKIKKETSSQSVQAAKGTVQWMAPELFNRVGGAATKASDIYSFGMVLWELVTRTLPFAEAENQMVVIGWIQAGQKESIPKDCPPLLKTLISDCWSAPLKRPRVAQVITRLKPLSQQNESKNVKRLSVVDGVESLAAPLSLMSVAALPNFLGGLASQPAERTVRSPSVKPLLGEADFREGEKYYLLGAFSKAAPYLKKAAEQNHPLAYVRLARMYAIGLGVSKDDHQEWRCSEQVKTHWSWLESRAKSGNIENQYYLGFCYKFGIAVMKNEEEAVVWYRRAADQSYSNAQTNLALCYKTGQGVAKDEKEAVVWFGRAADQGNTRAQYDLGVCYENGIGVVKDKREALVWYRRAADQGDIRAQCNLGICYQNGIGVQKNEREAVAWYRRAADQGNAGAQYNLGMCYQNGIGVQKNEREAVAWYRRAADQGDVHAQCNLGLCYENGRGVAKDEREAVVWYRRAAD